MAAVDIPERKARIDSIFGRIFILKVSEDGRKADAFNSFSSRTKDLL